MSLEVNTSFAGCCNGVLRNIRFKPNIIEEFLKENFLSEITVCRKHIHRFIRKCFLMNVLKRFSKSRDI